MSNELGARVSTHAGTIAAGGWWWYIGGVLLVSGVLGAAKGDFGALAVASAVALAVLVLPVLRWKQRVDVYERGLVWTRLLGPVTIGAKEVVDTTLTRNIGRMGETLELEIELANGKTHTLVGLEGTDQIRSFVVAWTARPEPAEVTATARSAWAPPGGLR
jgi:hypothetical protein